MESHSRLWLLQIRYQLDKIMQTGSNDDFAEKNASNLFTRKKAMHSLGTMGILLCLSSPLKSRSALKHIHNFIIEMACSAANMILFVIFYRLLSIDNNHFQDSIKFGYGICFCWFCGFFQLALNSQDANDHIWLSGEHLWTTSTE